MIQDKVTQQQPETDAKSESAPAQEGTVHSSENHSAAPASTVTPTEPVHSSSRMDTKSRKVKRKSLRISDADADVLNSKDEERLRQVLEKLWSEMDEVDEFALQQRLEVGREG